MSNILSQDFTVGESGHSNRCSDVRRIIINANVLKAARIHAGEELAIASADVKNAEQVFAVGVAWPSLELEQTKILASTSTMLTAKLEPGCRAHVVPFSTIQKALSSIPPLNQARTAARVVFRETTLHFVASSSISRLIPGTDYLGLVLREWLVSLKYFPSYQQLCIPYHGQTRHFCVEEVQDTVSANADIHSLESRMDALSTASVSSLYIATWDTAVSIAEASTALTVESSRQQFVELHDSNASASSYATVGGLDKQISQVRDLLEIPLLRPELFHHFGLKPPRGILLHGPPGTGKTHLARAIAAATKSSVIIVNGPELSSAYHGETESKLRDVFHRAREKSPCIIVLDEVDALAPRREDSAGGEVEKRVVATLLTLMDGMEGDSGTDSSGRVVVVATTNRPNAIDPALRRPGRFDREIEIGIPDAIARLSILRVLLAKTPHTISDNQLQAIASRAHGYVGADLTAVVREAGTIAIRRFLGPEASYAQTSVANATMQFSDIEAALPLVRPSAMRSIFLETPMLRYADIGGQADAVQKLKEAVEWPLLHPETFSRLGVRPPKGVLLYGPPGCSKTILVRACACESGLNFVAVKGPELLNKYVGESERGVRDIFGKARAAAPAIVFFDEIDALATSRSAGDSASSHEGVLTTLLNEMDGVQELVGVTVVAATNRPDVIDSALMRPGRLDRIVFVGPPDAEGREEIVKIHTRHMSVDPAFNAEEIALLTDGCSGAEIASVCQEAAMLTMKYDMNAPYVTRESFLSAAKSSRRQITNEILQGYSRWAESNGAKHV